MVFLRGTGQTNIRVISGTETPAVDNLRAPLQCYLTEGIRTEVTSATLNGGLNGRELESESRQVFSKNGVVPSSLIHHTPKNTHEALEKLTKELGDLGGRKWPSHQACDVHATTSLPLNHL